MGPTSAFELNVGVPPLNHRLVPFGTPGWAYVPKELREKRGAPKYQRSEPVLMIGYQHMYTHVYKCLTVHNTVIHTEQVKWDTKAPLGHMLESIDLAKDIGKPAAHRLEIDDVRIDTAELAEDQLGRRWSFVPVAVGFFLGGAFLYLCDV